MKILATLLRIVFTNYKQINKQILLEGANTIDLGALQIAAGKYVLTATQGGARQSINFIWN